MLCVLRVLEFLVGLDGGPWTPASEPGRGAGWWRASSSLCPQGGGPTQFSKPVSPVLKEPSRGRSPISLGGFESPAFMLHSLGIPTARLANHHHGSGSAKPCSWGTEVTVMSPAPRCPW